MRYRRCDAVRICVETRGPATRRAARLQHARSHCSQPKGSLFPHKYRRLFFPSVPPLPTRISTCLPPPNLYTPSTNTRQDPPRLKLTDFGCARRWEKQAAPSKLARFRTFAGTPAYMAPQVRDAGARTGTSREAGVCSWFWGVHLPFVLQGFGGSTYVDMCQGTKDSAWSGAGTGVETTAEASSLNCATRWCPLVMAFEKGGGRRPS
jgi:serine/threonine protein kinase